MSGAFCVQCPQWLRLKWRVFLQFLKNPLQSPATGHKILRWNLKTKYKNAVISSIIPNTENIWNTNSFEWRFRSVSETPTSGLYFANVMGNLKAGGPQSLLPKCKSVWRWTSLIALSTGWLVSVLDPAEILGTVRILEEAAIEDLEASLFWTLGIQVQDRQKREHKLELDINKRCSLNHLPLRLSGFSGAF